MIAIELYIMNTVIDPADETAVAEMDTMMACVLKLDAWINGKCFGEADRKVVTAGISIIFGLAAPKGDPATMVCLEDMVQAAEMGILDVSAEEAEQAWIDITEKNGVNNDGSRCVDASKLDKPPPMLAADGAAPAVETTASVDALTGRRLRYVQKAQKARKLTERAHARLRRELRKERQLEVFEKYYGEGTTNVFPPLRRKLSDHLRVQEAMSAGARKLQVTPTPAMPIQFGTSYHNFDLGAADHRDATEIACTKTGSDVDSLISGLATACPRECIFNNSMPEDLFAAYTCAEPAGVSGPCPACSSSLEFGDACKSSSGALGTCVQTALALAANEDDMKCLLKFSFHEIHRLWEMKEYLGYLAEQCSTAYDENELTAGAFSTATGAGSMVVPLSFQQTGTTGKILKVRASCTLENVMENDADARMFFDGAAPWAVTAEDIQGSMIAVTEAASTMLKESNAMMQASMEEQAESGLLPEADGALLADMMATVFESKMGSCSAGHECSSAEAEATSVPPPAAIYAYVNALGGPGGVIVPAIESSLDTGAFGSSECLVI